MLNNSMSATTGKTSNDVAYGFSLNKALDLSALPHQLPSPASRSDVADAISFAQIS